MSKKTTKSPAPSVLLVGNKPSMNYVLFTVNQLQDAKTIIIKARGRSIHRAVDVAEILRRRFITTLKIEKIELGTEEVEDKETKKMRRISTIEITVLK